MRVFGSLSPRRRHGAGFGVFMLAAVAAIGAAQATPLKLDYKSFNLKAKFPVLTQPTSGLHTDSVSYDHNDQEGLLTLPHFVGDSSDPIFVAAPSAPMQDAFNAAFAAAGWSIQTAATPLSDDSLIVRSYNASDADTQSGGAFAVGTEFHMQYAPHGTDPTTDLHWVQFVGEWAFIGTPFEKKTLIVDNGGAAKPYYDTLGTADAADFYDFPVEAGNNAYFNYIWLGYTFLVSGGAAPGPVTFYGGVGWGWNNTFPVPEPGHLGVILAAAALWRLRPLRRKG